MALFGLNISGRQFEFADDEKGSASTEWMVAVSIVVMLAVPVLGVVGDGAGVASTDIAIQIEDTDSMGGDSFHGDDDGGQSAELALTDFVPGEDMGIGFGDGEALQTASLRSRRTQVSSTAGSAGVIRRDKPVTSLLDDPSDFDTPTTDSRPYAVPTAPILISQQLRVSDDHCAEDIVADVDGVKGGQSVPIRVVQTSGR